MGRLFGTDGIRGKAFGKGGFKLSDEMEAEIEEEIG